MAPPRPFFIFLSGGGGVGKTFTVKCIIEYMRIHLKYEDQNADEQPSFFVCASTGAAAVRVGGNTLHSTFAMSRDQSSVGLKPRQQQSLQAKCRYLNIVVTDEVSMTGRPTWNRFEERLRVGKGIKEEQRTEHPYGDVSVLAVGDYFQLPPVMQGYNFESETKKSNPMDTFYEKDIWKDQFKLHELTEIVRQKGDPIFSEVMSRVRIGCHTEEDIDVLAAMRCNCCILNCGLKCKCDCLCISDWPCEPIYLYMTNALADAHNKRKMEELQSQVYIIRAKDSDRDISTNRCTGCTIDPSLPISKTGNLHPVFRVCNGARVMITVNVDTKDGIVNGAIGTVKAIQQSSERLRGAIYVLFDIQEVGASKKVKKGSLEGCVPIEPIVQKFKYNPNKKSEVLVSRKQYPLQLAHAITIHKSQSATYKYLVVDFNLESKGIQDCDFKQGQQYTAFSRGEERKRIIVKNFDPAKKILTNRKALKEMERLKDGHLLKDITSHPLEEKKGCVVTLLNIRSWNYHIEHFINEKIHLQKSDVLCFTETKNPRNSIEKLTNNSWSAVMKNTAHGLAICLKNETVSLQRRLNSITSIEILSLLITHSGMDIALSVVYRQPNSAVNVFLENLRNEILAQPPHVRKIIVGDFNIDLMTKSNANMINSFAEDLGLKQKVTYSTHIGGGILDLVMDSGSSGAADWMPSPYSDHFIIFYATIC